MPTKKKNRTEIMENLRNRNEYSSLNGSFRENIETVGFFSLRNTQANLPYSNIDLRNLASNM